MISLEEEKKIADQYGTPVYIFDLEALEDHVKRIRAIAGNKYSLCYSIKANPFLVQSMEKLTDRLEVCSPGELEICAHLQVSPDKILYSGVNKTAENIKRAMEYGVTLFTAESLKHMRLISEEAVKEGKQVIVYPRLNAGSQFGMSREDFLYIIDHSEEFPGALVKGMHYFAGTQRKNPSRQLKEIQFLKEFLHDLQQSHGVKLEYLEYGPGLSVSMFEKDDFSDVLRPLKEIHEALSDLAEDVNLTIEMGRFYTAYCGTYLTRVMDLKASDGENYCIIDGGINHITYYGSMMGMNTPVIEHIHTGSGSQKKTWCVCGSLCSVNDVEARKFEAEGLQEGDILAFKNIGSYSVTEGIYLFLSRTMPKVLLRKGKKNYSIARDFQETWPLNTMNL